MYKLIKLPKEELNAVTINTAAKKRDQLSDSRKRSLGLYYSGLFVSSF